MGKVLTVVLIERKEQYSMLPPQMLPRCGMGGGSVMNWAVICVDVLYARKRLSIKMSVGIVLLFMRVYVLTVAQR